MAKTSHNRARKEKAFQEGYLRDFVINLRQIRDEKRSERANKYLIDFLRYGRRNYLLHFPAIARSLVEKALKTLEDMDYYRFLKESLKHPTPPELKNDTQVKKNIESKKRYLEKLESTKEEREERFRSILYAFQGIKKRKTLNERLQINDEKLLELHEKIKPVLLYHGKLVEIVGNKGKCGRKDYFETIESLRNISFIWSPIYGKTRADLEKLAQITTRHTCGYIGFFKPSIAEILAQIPKRYIKDTIAYETGREDKDICGSSSGDYHIAKTRLYRSRKQLT